MVLEVLDTAKYVVDEGKTVQIHIQALRRFCGDLVSKDIKVPPWSANYHLCNHGEKTVMYLLILDSINFCFWPAPKKPKWHIQCGKERLSGYYALAAALKRAVEAGGPLTSAEYLSRLSLTAFQEILHGEGELQLMEERVHILRELGRVLTADFQGNPTALIAAAGRSAPNLARLLAEKMPSFRDTTFFKGLQIFFYKRAQIFAADLYGAFGGSGWGRLKDMESLTCFADYKLPQILRHVGILSYAPPLAKKVNQGLPLEPQSPEEAEIRANTVWAVELIRRQLEHLGRAFRAFEVDWILWDLAQHEPFNAKPYHRTLTTFY